MIPASVLTLTPGAHPYQLAIPPGMAIGSPVANQQGDTGYRLLRALNRTMIDCRCGGRCGPFRSMIIFNDDDHIELPDELDEIPENFWWKVGEG